MCVVFLLLFMVGEVCGCMLCFVVRWFLVRVEEVGQVIWVRCWLIVRVGVGGLPGVKAVVSMGG